MILGFFRTAASGSFSMYTFNETDINPPAELGRLADASGDEQSTRIKTPAV